MGLCNARRAGPSSEKGGAVLAEWARRRGAAGRGLRSPALSRLDNALEPPDRRAPAPPEHWPSPTQGLLAAKAPAPKARGAGLFPANSVLTGVGTPAEITGRQERGWALEVSLERAVFPGLCWGRDRGPGPCLRGQSAGEGAAFELRS